MYDSDGNRLDAEGGLLRGNASKNKERKVMQELQSGESFSGVVGGEGASSQRAKKGGASKKEMLEMRKQSERLQRSTYIELPARRGNLDINKFLSLYNIQRPEPQNKGWEAPEDSDDDPEDVDYVPPDQASANETSTVKKDAIPSTTDTTSCTDTTKPIESKSESSLEASKESDMIESSEGLDTKQEGQDTQTVSEPKPEVKVEQTPVIAPLLLKSDSTISTTQLSLLQISNRALIRQQLDRSRALQELRKPNGKGRQLTAEEQLLVQDFDPELSEKAEKNGENSDDDGIEIVEVVDPATKAARDLAAKQARMTAAEKAAMKVTIEEKNRRLKLLAIAQNKARREEEAREYAEALEAKKRKREEKKALRRAKDEEEDDNENG
ncbi:hypothetical protein BDR26DRAFT_590472 [Obelidium mucronatum]|nr:hypothetical protein BDR26DRAFT_590472 [Obelidium mucronatum]